MKIDFFYPALLVLAIAFPITQKTRAANVFHIEKEDHSILLKVTSEKAGIFIQKGYFTCSRGEHRAFYISDVLDFTVGCARFTGENIVDIQLENGLKLHLDRAELDKANPPVIPPPT